MQFSLQTQAQIAGGVALLCLVFGAAAWEIATGHRKWLGRATIAGGVLQLMAFSHHAVGQYQVVLAAHKLPLLEVANSDAGRERIIERIDDGTGITIEREHIAGWRFVSATGRGYKADRSMLRGIAGDPGSGCCTESGDREGKGCICGLLEMPGCCPGGCPDCQCNQLEIAGNGRQF